MNKKCELKHMTWVEAKEAFDKDPVVIIPMASMEVHGPHCPVGDFMITDAVAKDAAEKTGAYVVPGCPYGLSEYFRSFPGTISIKTNTLYSYLYDIVDCLICSGVSKILFLNGHAGNNATLEALSRDIRRERGIMIPYQNLWAMLSREVSKEVYGDAMGKMGHGGGPVDTVQKYLNPEDIRMDLYDKAKHNNKTQWQAFPMKGLGKTVVNGQVGFMPFDMKDISEVGSLGQPDVGDAEGGKRFYDNLVETCVAFVEMMQKSDMHVE